MAGRDNTDVRDYYRRGTTNVTGRIARVMGPEGDLISLHCGAAELKNGDVLEVGQELVATFRRQSPLPTTRCALILTDAAGGEYFLALTPVVPVERYALHPGAEIVISEWMNECFRPDTIDIESDSEGDLFVRDIRIANCSQMASKTPAPVEIFRNLAMRFSAASVGQCISVAVQNNGNSVRHVKVQMGGRALVYVENAELS